MPERTQEQARALLRLSSAAQGVMVGMVLAQGSVMNFAFSLIFLSYGIVKIVALFATLTVAAIGLKKLFYDLPKAAQAVGQSFEATGQQMASFLRSAQMAWDVMEQARIVAQQYGVAIDDARQAIFELTKVNQAQAPVIEALLNASAATGRAFSDVARQYSEILRASNEERSRLVQQFAKDMDITVRDYANTIDLITAINDRFAGSAAAQAQTTAGMIARIWAYINSLMTDIGNIVNQAIKPVVAVFHAFFQGLFEGFRTSYDSARASGKLDKELKGIRDTATDLIPKMYELGYVIGRALFNAIMFVIRAIKLFLQVLRAMVNAVKWVIDQIRAVAQVLKKETLATFLESPPVVTGVVTTIINTLEHLIGYISDDFVKGLRTSADDIGRGFGKIGSVLDDIFRGIARATEGLSDDIGKGLKPLSTTLDDVAGGLRRGASKVTAVIDDLFRTLLRSPKSALDDVGKGFRGLADNLISSADDMVRGVVPALRSVGSSIGSFADDLIGGIVRVMSSGSFDDIIRGFFTGLGNAFRNGISTATSLFDDIGRGISSAFKGALTLTSGIDDVARGFWGSLKTIFTVPKEIFAGLIDGLKSGLIIALIEAVTLQGVDQLPISEQLKTSITGVVETTFLGAGLGTAFGPAGIAIGAGIGAAIGLGLEAVKPGLSKEMMDKLNGAIGGAMEGVINFTREKVIPWSQEFIQGFTGVGGEADTTAQKLGGNFREAVDTVGEALGRATLAVGDLTVKAGKLAADIGSHADDAWRKLKEILNTIGDYIETRFGPTWERLSTFFVQELVPAMKETYGWFKENIWPIIEGLTKFIVEHVMPVLGELALWFSEKILKALGTLIDFGIKVALKWFNDFFDFFKAYAWPVLKFTIEQIGNLVEVIIDIGKAIYEKAEPYLKAIWDFLENKLGPVINDVVEFGLKAMKRVLDEIANMPTPFGILKAALDGIKEVVTSIWDMLQNIKNFDIGDVAKKIPGAGALSKLGKIDINPFSTGGIVRGPYPGDTVPAMLSPGEVILNAAQQRNLVGLMAALAASPGDTGGGGTLIINVSLPNSVVADESSMNSLAGRVADAITTRLGSGRKFTYHRV
jgi:phage-related protein